jgi:hypothetical protein
MDDERLAEWASQGRPEMSEAVVADIREHWAGIPGRGDVYGYAILPGDPATSAEGIGPLVAAYNRVGDVGAGPEEGESIYYKYSVDEWRHWERGKFPRADSVLASLNARFAAAHRKGEEDFEIDAIEKAYSRSVLGTILDGVAAVKAGGEFGEGVEFLAIWVSDSGNPIVEESVRRLNSRETVERFVGEFGGGSNPD